MRLQTGVTIRMCCPASRSEQESKFAQAAAGRVQLPIYLSSNTYTLCRYITVHIRTTACVNPCLSFKRVLTSLALRRCLTCASLLGVCAHVCSGALSLLSRSEGANSMYHHLMPFSKPEGEQTRQASDMHYATVMFYTCQ
jgi:hypothetical protein